MARYAKLLSVSLSCCIIVILIIDYGNCRGRGGGRSGGFRSSSRSYRSSSTYRSRGSSSYSSRSNRYNYGGTSYSSRGRPRTYYSGGGRSYAYMAVGAVTGYMAARMAMRVHGYGYYGGYGSRRYQDYRYYRNRRDAEPTICEKDDGNFTAFICPHDNVTDDDTYCCGEEGSQYCCDFWADGGRTAGALIGIVIAVIVGIGIVACCIRCCLKSSEPSHKPASTIVTYQDETEENDSAKTENYPPPPAPQAVYGTYPPPPQPYPAPPGQPQPYPAYQPVSTDGPATGYPAYPPPPTTGVTTTPYPPTTGDSTAAAYPPYPTTTSSVPPPPAGFSAETNEKPSLTSQVVEEMIVPGNKDAVAITHATPLSSANPLDHPKVPEISILKYDNYFSQLNSNDNPAAFKPDNIKVKRGDNIEFIVHTS